MSLMGKYEILDIKDAEKWNIYLNYLPKDKQDVYFSPDYYRLFENRGVGKAQCFVYKIDDLIALYPYLINSINELGFNLNRPYFDIQGVYGYNGVLTNSSDQSFLSAFFKYFDEYCVEKNIVTEFLRLNPLIQNHFVDRANFDIIYDRDNVNINLLSEEIFEVEYEYSVRKNIRKAVKSGLTFKWILGNEINSSDLNSFLEIYNHTMSRNNADEFYYFNQDFFRDISYNLKDKTLFVFVLYEDKIISCELVLLGSEIAYSFLGGTISEYYQYRPNDFLKHETIVLLKKLGFSSFLLGGGPDGVFKYKKTFSKNGVIPFYIGREIHNKEIYEEVVSQWALKYPEKSEKYKNFILKYRY